MIFRERAGPLRNGDVVSGLVLAALGAFIVQQALGWDYMTADGPGAGFFPRWYGIAMVVLSLVLVIRGLRAPAAANAPATDASLARVVTCWGAVVACVVLFKWLGFVASFALLCWFIATALFARSQRVAIAMSAMAAVAFWLVFDVALGVSLPRGAWGG
jgi:putative tricarboxylic transport membrane protein